MVRIIKENFGPIYSATVGAISNVLPRVAQTFQSGRPYQGEFKQGLPGAHIMNRTEQEQYITYMLLRNLEGICASHKPKETNCPHI